MSTSALSRPPKVEHPFRRVAIVFAGGPAPGANAVISTAAVSFFRNEIQVVGILHGYSHLVEFDPEKPLEEGPRLRAHRPQAAAANPQFARNLDRDGPHQPRPATSRTRSIWTTRCASAPLRTVYEALCSLEVDALVSIGGDDTLKTANKFKMFQDRLPAGSRRIPVVHLAQDDRQRLHGHRFHVRLLHGRRHDRRRNSQSAGRRRGESSLLPHRSDGPQRRLARLWRGHRRRSQPGDQRRRRVTAATATSKKASIRMTGAKNIAARS